MNDPNNSSSALHTSRVAKVLVRLFRESEASDKELVRMLGDAPPEERARRVRAVGGTFMFVPFSDDVELSIKL
jgi:hypothetical protein